VNSDVVQQAEIITTMPRLCQVVEILNNQTEIALDLEMDSLHHYKEKVCLLQVSTRTESWLIDPLALNNVKPLADPLENPNIRIVMHGADYDVRSLFRDFEIAISNLFDTMIASRLLGMAECGLAAILKNRFDIQLDKKYQKADWSKRPLSLEMINYAAADTATLLPLYDQLSAELMEKGRELWFLEECNLVCRARVSEKEGPFFISCKGAGKLNNESLTILENILILRDKQAQKLDRPPFKVMSAETMLEIAEKRPHTLHDLSAIKGMTPAQVSRFGPMIFEAISNAMAVPPERRLSFPRQRRKETSEGAKERIKNLKIWREDFSRQLGLDPGVVAPNWILESLADANAVTISELDSIIGMREWQKQLYGEMVLQN